MTTATLESRYRAQALRPGFEGLMNKCPYGCEGTGRLWLSEIAGYGHCYSCRGTGVMVPAGEGERTLRLIEATPKPIHINEFPGEKIGWGVIIGNGRDDVGATLEDALLAALEARRRART